MSLRQACQALVLAGGACAIAACAQPGARPAVAGPMTNFCKKSPGVVDGAIVIRGGEVNATKLREGGDVGPDGYMTDLSVNCSGSVDAPNTQANRKKYRDGIPNSYYGVTSARRICQEGGYLAPTPYAGHPYHCTLWHMKPERAAPLFTRYKSKSD